MFLAPEVAAAVALRRTMGLHRALCVGSAGVLGMGNLERHVNFVHIQVPLLEG